METKSNLTLQDTEIKCPKCEMYSDFNYTSFVDGTIDSKEKNSVLAGSLFYYECPYCGERMNFKLPFVYTNFIYNFSIVLTYEKEKSEEIILNYKKSLIQKVNEENKDYITKHKFICVNDYKDLIEKIMILESGLDDRVIEIEKILNWGNLYEEDRDGCSIYFSVQNGTYYFIAYSNEGLIEKIPFRCEEYNSIKQEFITNENRPFIVDKQYAIKIIDAKL